MARPCPPELRSPFRAARRPRVLRTTAVICAVALASVFLASCSRGAEAEVQSRTKSFDEPVSIENCGRTETFDAPPQRIISMNDHVTETLIQMGAADRIVGMGYGEQDDPLPETADQFRRITSLATEYPTYEQIRDLDPDLVVGGMRSAFDDKSGLGRDRLEGDGIDTFLFSEYCGAGFSDIDLLTDDFSQLGEVLGVQEGARELTDRITGGLDRVHGNIAAAEADPVPTFFYDSGQDQPLSVGGVGIGNLVGQYAGADNITAEGPKPYFSTSWEVVGERAPEAIVVLDYGKSSAQEKIDFLRSQPIMQTTPAVQNDRFVVVPLSDMFESSRMVLAADDIARGLHPDAFADAG